jgi:hypothetical protein
MKRIKLKERYYNPTPKKWRKLGDALLAIGVTLTGYAIADDWDKWIQITSLILTVIGKFLTNFFTED